MSQTTINAAGQPVGRAGLIADTADFQDVITAVSEEASAEVPFGCGVTQGTADDGVLLPSTSTSYAKGIAVYDASHQVGTTGDVGTTGLKPKALFGIMRKGRIYVTVEEAVSAGDRPYMRYAAGGTYTQLGSFRKSQDATGAGSSNTALDMTKQGQFLTSASAGGLAVLEVDFTAKP